MTVRFHVDDCLSSHKDKTVNNNFLWWWNKLYGKHTEVKAMQGSIPNYLGMTLWFGDGELVVDMQEYVKNILKEFLVNSKTRWSRQ